MRGWNRRAQHLFSHLVKGDLIRACTKALTVDSSWMLLLVVLIDAERPRPLVRRIVSGVLATERGMINNVLVEIDTKQ